MIQLSSKDYFALKKELENGESFFEVIRDGDSVHLSLLPVETMCVTSTGYAQIIGEGQHISFKPDQVLHLRGSLNHTLWNK